jgi:hypothetical protein|tara:strand:- start:47 stop:430 length:384 start_codon:yes stop_codon:yes gene_type:complete
MQNRETYEFAIIRIVPKVEREEFLNVGVILFSKRKKYLKMAYQIDEKRMAAFSTEIDIAALNAYLKGWELVCEGAPNGGKIGEFDLAFRFRWLTASRSTIIQSSKTHPGLCDNPQKELEDLFELYVL